MKSYNTIMKQFQILLKQMSLEQAILRKIRQGGSFCSYSFKTAKSMNGSIALRMQRNTSDNSCKSDISLSTNVSRRDEQNQSTLQEHTKMYKKPNTPYSRMKKNVQTQRKRPTTGAKKLEKENINSKKQQTNKVNKMDQYLEDFFKLKSAVGYKNNVFQNIPKIEDISHNKQFVKKSMKKINSQFAFSVVNKFKFQKYHQAQVFSNFQFYNHIELFYDFSFEENNAQLPFTNFTMINLQNKMYIKGPVNQNLFSEISMKQYQQRLNDFSTKIQQNIFYLSLGKLQTEDQFLPYTQGFFWISMPIKHTERKIVLEYIKKFIQNFMLNCFKRYPRQKQRIIGSKIWVVDFYGRISYINKEQFQGCFLKEQENQLQEEKRSSIKTNREVCLEIFLSCFKKGNFSRDSILSYSPFETPRSEIHQIFDQVK